MPWRCPACRTEIQHHPAEHLPDPFDTYRCDVCRFDLRFDVRSRKMVLAPFQSDDRVTVPGTRLRSVSADAQAKPDDGHK